MKKLWLLLLMAMLLQLVHSQEVKHAPTVEQCRADQNLWLSKLQDHNTRLAISYKEINSWLPEMADCMSVDSDNQLEYVHTLQEINVSRVQELSTSLGATIYGTSFWPRTHKASDDNPEEGDNATFKPS